MIYLFPKVNPDRRGRNKIRPGTRDLSAHLHCYVEVEIKITTASPWRPIRTLTQHQLTRCYITYLIAPPCSTDPHCSSYHYSYCYYQLLTTRHPTQAMENHPKPDLPQGAHPATHAALQDLHQQKDVRAAVIADAKAQSAQGELRARRRTLGWEGRSGEGVGEYGDIAERKREKETRADGRTIPAPVVELRAPA